MLFSAQTSRRTAPDSSPFPPRWNVTLRGDPEPTALHVLSIQFVFCCRCSGRSLPRPHELPPSAVLGDTESCSGDTKSCCAWGHRVLICLGDRPALSPWLSLFSHRSDRALAAPLQGSPLPVPSQACSCCSQSWWKCSGGGHWWPWGRCTWEPAPDAVLGQLQPGQAEQGSRMGPSPLDRHRARLLGGRQGEEGGSTLGVPIPAPPDASAGLSCSPGAPALLQGWAVLCQGLCPQGCPAAPWPCWTRPPSLAPHSDPMGALGSCCSPWPQDPPANHPLCCRTGLCSPPCGLL